MESERSRFRALIARGSEYRLEKMGALYEFFQALEAVRGPLGESHLGRRFLGLALDFVGAIAQSDELEVYMGSSNTDAYGVVTDAEVTRDGVRFGLKWSRDMPHRRLFVECSLEESVAIGVAVDRHRASGRLVGAADLSHLLPFRVWSALEEEVQEAAESDRDREQLLEAQARALDAQSIMRVLVLAEAFPEALPRHPEPSKD